MKSSKGNKSSSKNSQKDMEDRSHGNEIISFQLGKCDEIIFEDKN